MHHEDLTAPVLAGLAWYYLLAAMMNAAAAAYVSYGEMVSEGASRVGLTPKTRRMPVWLIGTFFGLYGLAVLIILFRHSLPDALTVAYFLCAAGNGLLAVIAGADAAHFAEMKAHGHGEGDPSTPPSLDDHQPAVGLGGPINRTLWTLIWSIAAVIFQAMGITYILGGSILMPQFMRDAVDLVAGPTTFFVGATLAFVALLRWRRFFASGLVGWAAVIVFLLYFGLSMTDYDFRDIVTKPDNVPIVGLLILVGYFDWFALRRAVINDSRIEQNLPTLEHLEPEKTLTWPDLVYTELICMVVLTIVLVVWGIALQAPLEQPASSTVAPNPSKAPWYFLGLQEMLVYFDPWIAGVLLPSLIIVGLIAIPYIDTNKNGNGYYSYNDRKFAYITFQYGFVVLWVVLILLGTFLRGPNWNFFGPYEFWDLHKLIPLNNVQLSDMIWIQLMGVSKPTNYVIRELPGILIILGYFILTPYIMYQFFFKKYAKEAGMLRFMTLAILMLFMASLPIKMVLRWTINLKYIVAIPELFFNI
jgi:cytochrome b/b6/petD-like protein